MTARRRSHRARRRIADPAFQALKEAVAEAIEMHRRLGNPIAIGRGGRVYLVHPDGREELVEEPPPRQPRRPRGPVSGRRS